MAQENGVIQVRGLRVGYAHSASMLGRQQAVIIDGLDWDIYPFTIYGVIGGNGRGKSSLMRGIVDPAARGGGTILKDGAPLGLEQIAWVPQTPALSLSPWLRVEDEAGLSLRIRGHRPAEWRKVVGERLDELQLQIPAKRPVTALSGGQKVAVALLRAACVPSPSLVVFDEPYEGLAPDARRTLTAALRKIAYETGTPVLVSSHRAEDLEELGATCFAPQGVPIDRLEPLEPRAGSPTHARSDRQPVGSMRTTPAPVHSVGGQRRDALHASLQSAAGIVLGLMVWEIAARVVQNPGLIPPPSSVGSAALEVFANGEERACMGTTLLRIYAAWILANASAVPLGILIGYRPSIYRMFGPWLSVVRSVPIFTLIGAAAGLFPRAPEVQRLALAFLSVFAFSLHTVAAGAALVEKPRLEIARQFGANHWFRLTRIMPFEVRAATYSAFEVSLPLATVITCVIEVFLIPETGVGGLLHNHFHDSDLSTLFAYLLVLGVSGLVGMALVRWLAHRSPNDHG